MLASRWQLIHPILEDGSYFLFLPSFTPQSVMLETDRNSYSEPSHLCK